MEFLLIGALTLTIICVIAIQIYLLSRGRPVYKFGELEARNVAAAYRARERK
jgi:hypothetical protein